MKIIGVDPGLQKTGWGIIESNGYNLRFVACGLIRTNSKEDLSKRLACLHHNLTAVLEEWNPKEAAVEETFVNKNPASALKLGQARGVLLAVPAINGIPVEEYSANKIKKSVVGSGHAAKEQVGMMVKTLLPACGTLKEDEADALAVAITHAHYRSINTVISGA
ncbi:MAG: crossover junction endodeoxyribonuclease RuvC [Alphaproteobacteria bacterium]